MSSGQKMFDDKGDAVEFLDSVYEKKYRKIETDTHKIDRMQDAILAKVQKVTELRDSAKFIAADSIAENFIRSATKPMAIVRKMKREDYFKSYENAVKLFKETIFGYNQLTEKERAADLSNEEKKKQ